MNTLSHVPPGFRFHPTDEELVDYYLRKKIASEEIDLHVIKDVDLHKIEPWDLEETCRIGAQEESEWYLFNHKDKKYPTGTRTNRATISGFWKATGRDKPVYSKQRLVGMRKTLVFYQGRAPNGRKSDWIMHEYRLEYMENAPPQEEGWVVCRVFRKKVAPMRMTSDHEHRYGYNSQLYFTSDFDLPTTIDDRQTSFHLFHEKPYTCKREIGFLEGEQSESFVHLPRLESPTNQGGVFVTSESSFGSSSPVRGGTISAEQRITDWRVFEKLVASQLSPGGALEEDHYPEAGLAIHAAGKKEQVGDHGSTSRSVNQTGVWK